MKIRALFFVLTFSILGHVLGQNSSSPLTLAEILTPQTNPPNEALAAAFPPTIFRVQTPIAIRYAVVASAASYELIAACLPKALSFFGTNDTIPDRFCTSPLSRALTQSQLTYRILASEFPIEGVTWARFLIKNGVNPFTRSRDKNTEAGWANVVSDRLVTYFQNDGWNSQGDLTKRNYRVQFEDYTDYTPENNAADKPESLRRPLRWQPLTGTSDDRGAFAEQVHVLPQIGARGLPLVLTRRDIERRKAPSLYNSPNRRNNISTEDEKLALNLVRKLFQRSRNLTARKIATAYFWESKFFSLGAFVGFYQAALGFDDLKAIQLFLGEALAQYDAVLVAWKEKRRHDLVRPTTLIRRLLQGKQVEAFRGVGKGVGLVSAEEWEPVVPIQPHSEYPSASAVICTASMEHLKVGLEELILRGNGTIPSFELDIEPGLLPVNPIEDTVKVRFRTLEAAARSCGQSRLNAGVHFGPSVPAGNKLARGIGKAAFEHTRDLFEGRIPNNCRRCRDRINI